MSIDSLGRVVVASGHFADQTPHIMENVSRFMADERIVSNLERTSTHVERGVGNLWSSAKKVDQFLGDKLYDIRFAEKKPAIHVEKGTGRLFGFVKKIDQSLGDKLYDIRFPTNLEQGSRSLSTAITDRASDREAAERMSQQAGENLEKLGEAGKDFLEAFGWGAAGDLESATSKTVDGAVKMAEVFWKGLKGPASD